MWILIGIAVILLGICTVSDIKRRAVDLLVILGFLMAALLYRGCEGIYWLGITELILRFVPGIILLFVSFAAPNSIGEGDALTVMATGYILGCEYNFYMLICGSLISGVYSLVMLCFKKKKIRDTLPFVPFLLSGMAGPVVIMCLRMKP